MVTRTEAPILILETLRLLSGLCRHCSKPEGDHAAQGAWCPNPESSGPLWLKTQFQPVDPCIPIFEFQTPEDLDFSDRDCRIILTFLIGWFKKPTVATRVSDDFAAAMNLAMRSCL